MITRLILTVCAALLIIAGVEPASGVVLTIYDDPATFSAAVANPTTITFTGDAPAGGYTEYAGAMTTESGVTFQGNGDLFAVSDSYFTPYEFNTGVVLSFQQAPSGTNMLTITPPVGTTAFALDFGAGTAVPFTFTLSTGDAIVKMSGQSLNQGGSGYAFLGFSSPTPIVSVVISESASSDGPSIDNVTFGAVVPEPSTLWMAVAASGLLGAVWLRRRTA